MKRIILCLSFAVLIPLAPAAASDVGVSVGINIGAPAPPVYVAPPVVIREPPVFYAPPELGFYVAVGVPYDLFRISNRYYLYRGNVWYSSPYYNGPWVTVQYTGLPHGLRAYSVPRIHHYKNWYYKQYQKHGYWYGNRHFRPAPHYWKGGGHPGKGPGHGGGVPPGHGGLPPGHGGSPPGHGGGPKGHGGPH